MKFQDPDWRFESPGPLSDGAYHHFLAWAKRIASQGLVQDILEDLSGAFPTVALREAQARIGPSMISRT